MILSMLHSFYVLPSPSLSAIDLTVEVAFSEVWGGLCCRVEDLNQRSSI